jgi:hypothetical protein
MWFKEEINPVTCDRHHTYHTEPAQLPAGNLRAELITGATRQQQPGTTTSTGKDSQQQQQQ